MEYDQIKLEELSGEEQEILTDLFKAFGDLTRLRILAVLLDSTFVSVGSLATKLDMSVSAVSHQLKILKVNKLIGSRREGKNVLYHIADEHVASILRTAIEHVIE